MSTHVFGIRHHGPGSARSLRAALERLAPDVVLIEGPPDADAHAPLVADPDMRPPVALLVYAKNDPSRAAHYPFARFSPEWQALGYAAERDVPAQFIDLPMKHQLAMRSQETEVEDDGDEDEEARAARRDPLSLVARAAGYGDGERWWEQMVEERRDDTAVFDAITEVMAALRSELGPRYAGNRQTREDRREAHMRRCLRAAQKKHERVAVVCGAWHAPALVDLPPKRHDDALLKKLPRTKVEATWVPWTHGRLTFESGYGAGVRSPGWYDHLFAHVEHGGTRVSASWLTRAARLLRSEGIEVSSAHVIEAIRLAEALAALRERPLPGLEEHQEAVQTVFLFGDALPMALVHDKLVVGETLGQVPASVPTVPLQRDVEARQRRLRLEPQAKTKDLTLDLRKERDREKSKLLRCLRLLGVGWGRGGERGEGLGTYKEEWQLTWEPELSLAVIEAAPWGNRVDDAASACARAKAKGLDSLPALTLLAREVLFAELSDAVGPIMAELRDRAAVANDVGTLMDAAPELIHLLRYGDVRGTAADDVEPLVRGLMARVDVGLPPACSSLDDAAAEQMHARIDAVHEALALLEDPDLDDGWLDALARIADDERPHGLVRGRATRILLDGGRLGAEEATQRLALSLSHAEDPARGAAWLDGMLRGAGQLLLHDDELWTIVDDWLCRLPAPVFEEHLPLVRRCFSSFTEPERRDLGARARQARQGRRPMAQEDPTFRADRAARVVPLLKAILGR